MSEQKKMWSDEPDLTTPVCPSCGYKPADDVSDEPSRPVTIAEHALAERFDPLDFFEAIGADEGNVFCPRCGQEFNPKTGRKMMNMKTMAWPGVDCETWQTVTEI